MLAKKFNFSILGPLALAPPPPAISKLLIRTAITAPAVPVTPQPLHHPTPCAAALQSVMRDHPSSSHAGPPRPLSFRASHPTFLGLATGRGASRYSGCGQGMYGTGSRQCAAWCPRRVAAARGRRMRQRICSALHPAQCASAPPPPHAATEPAHAAHTASDPQRPT